MMDRETYREQWVAYLNDGADGITLHLATDEAAVVAEALGAAAYDGNWTEWEMDVLTRVAAELTPT